MSFYKMHRGWMDNPAFRNEPYSKREAWCWLVENAEFEGGRIVMLPKGDIELQRGQLTHSNRYLAKAWKCDERTVRRWFALFQSRFMVGLETASGQNVITICNYNEYQDIKTGPASPSASPAPHQRLTSASNIKKLTIKEDNNSKNNSLIMAFKKATAKIYGGDMVPPFFPNQSDTTIAKQLTKSGVTYDQAFKVIKDCQQSKFKSNQRPITSLKYFEKVFAEMPEKEDPEKIKMDHYRETGKWLKEWGPCPNNVETGVDTSN